MKERQSPRDPRPLEVRERLTLPNGGGTADSRPPAGTRAGVGKGRRTEMEGRVARATASRQVNCACPDLSLSLSSSLPSWPRGSPSTVGFFPPAALSRYFTATPKQRRYPPSHLSFHRLFLLPDRWPISWLTFLQLYSFPSRIRRRCHCNHRNSRTIKDYIYTYIYVFSPRNFLLLYKRFFSFTFLF